MDIDLLLQQSTFRRNGTLLHKEEKGLMRTLQSRACFPTSIRTDWEHSARQTQLLLHCTFPAYITAPFPGLFLVLLLLFGGFKVLDYQQTRPKQHFWRFYGCMKSSSEGLQNSSTALVLSHSFSTLTLGWRMKALLYFIELGHINKKNFFLIF